MWGTASGEEYKVEGFSKLLGEQCVVVESLTKESRLFASQLTHQRPVLDADGVPIREGDTVWCVATDEQLLDMNVSIVRGLNRGRELTVTDVTQRGGEPWARFEQTGFLIKTCYLTHAKPELDSWERIETDCMQDAKDYCEEHGIEPEYPKHSGKAKCEDLVRRCRALAERERGE